jgi:aspartyl-tRNA(Asn)/glutamyl-tRNA(Gln) amidotransferase subunit A
MIEHSLQAICPVAGDKEISSVELTQLYLDRIARHNPQLNAFITVDPSQQPGQARAADERLASGEGGPLTGIPIAHKDIFCAQGWLTTCGSKMLSNFVSPYDAAVISRFKPPVRSPRQDQHGRVRHGFVERNIVLRPGAQPLGYHCVPGGSSGGSAAAVAARLAPAATGTDTGGSIRQPAALCNLTGMKPTYGVVSRYGMIAFASSLDQAGPLARSAADCALLLNAWPASTNAIRPASTARAKTMAASSMPPPATSRWPD